jgi:hypothetical protein
MYLEYLETGREKEWDNININHVLASERNSEKDWNNGSNVNSSYIVQNNNNTHNNQNPTSITFCPI